MLKIFGWLKDHGPARGKDGMKMPFGAAEGMCRIYREGS